MDTLQRAAGIAALILALTLVVGLGMFATVLSDFTTGDFEASDSVAFIADHEALMYVWNTITLVVFGVVFVILALALHDRLRGTAPVLSRASAAFGLIWAGLLVAGGMVTNIGLGTVAGLVRDGSEAAEPVWLAVDSVQNGLSGGNEIVGGVWILLVSWAALRDRSLPNGLNYLGLAMGAAALVTIVPALEIVGALFGLGLIAYFIWLGTYLIRHAEVAQPQLEPQAV